MRTPGGPALDVLLVSRPGPDGRTLPLLRVAHDGVRATITWLASPEPTLLRLQTPAGPLTPERGRPFLDALQRQLKHRPGWTCDRTRTA